jgi:hypothetical protein
VHQVAFPRRSYSPTAAGILASQIHPDKAANPLEVARSLLVALPHLFALSRRVPFPRTPDLSRSTEPRSHLLSGIPSSIDPRSSLGHSTRPVSRAPHSHVPFSNRKRLEDYRIRIRREEGEEKRQRRMKRKDVSRGIGSLAGVHIRHQEKHRPVETRSAEPQAVLERRASVTWYSFGRVLVARQRGLQISNGSIGRKSNQSDLSASDSETTHTPSLLFRPSRPLALSLHPFSLFFPPFQLSPSFHSLSPVFPQPRSSSSAPAALCVSSTR